MSERFWLLQRFCLFANNHDMQCTCRPSCDMYIWKDNHTRWNRHCRWINLKCVNGVTFGKKVKTCFGPFSRDWKPPWALFNFRWTSFIMGWSLECGDTFSFKLSDTAWNATSFWGTVLNTGVLWLSSSIFFSLCSSLPSKPSTSFLWRLTIRLLRWSNRFTVFLRSWITDSEDLRLRLTKYGRRPLTAVYLYNCRSWQLSVEFFQIDNCQVENFILMSVWKLSIETCQLWQLTVKLDSCQWTPAVKIWKTLNSHILKCKTG